MDNETAIVATVSTNSGVVDSVSSELAFPRIAPATMCVKDNSGIVRYQHKPDGIE
jgi:hypothetical protein